MTETQPAYDPISDALQCFRPIGVALAATLAGMLFVACSDAKP